MLLYKSLETLHMPGVRKKNGDISQILVELMKKINSSFFSLRFSSKLISAENGKIYMLEKNHRNY